MYNYNFIIPRESSLRNKSKRFNCAKIENDNYFSLAHTQ